MSKFFFALFFYCCTSHIQAQSLRDSHYSNMGSIKADGTVQDSHYATVGYFKSDGTI